jgi:hypothetical protein
MPFIPDKIFVVGSGGTGGHLIPSLARLVNYHKNFTDSCPEILIIDGDDFEGRNQTRQFLRPSDIGKNKAIAMYEHCKSLGLNNVSYHSSYIDKKMITQMFGECDQPLVVSCVDNDATRKAMIDSINELFGGSSDYFFISPGNSDGVDEVKGQVLWYGEINEQKYGIDPSLLYGNLSNPDDFIPVAGTCSANTPSRPQLIAANFMAAAATLNVIQNLLDDMLDPIKSSFFFDLRSFETTNS